MRSLMKLICLFTCLLACYMLVTGPYMVECKPKCTNEVAILKVQIFTITTYVQSQNCFHNTIFKILALCQVVLLFVYS